MHGLLDQPAKCQDWTAKVMQVNIGSALAGAAQLFLSPATSQLSSTSWIAHTRYRCNLSCTRLNICDSRSAAGKFPQAIPCQALTCFELTIRRDAGAHSVRNVQQLWPALPQQLAAVWRLQQWKYSKERQLAAFAVHHTHHTSRAEQLHLRIV